MIKTTEIAWLGGLLEGEGCFGIRKKKYLFIRLKMTDKDTVVKVAAIWKSGVWKYKNTWLTDVNGIRAVEWMMTLYPYLNRNRRNTIIKVVKFWRGHAYTRASKGMHTMATCHPDRKVIASGLCSPCYEKKRWKAKKLLKKAG